MMENAYGVGVKNRYELFYDEDLDPLEIIRLQEAEKEKKKTDKTHGKDKNKTSSKPEKSVSAIVPKKNPKDISANQLKTVENTDKPRIKTFDKTARNSRGFDDIKELEEKKNLHNKEENSFGDRDEIRRGRGGFRGRGRARGRGAHFSNFEGRPPPRRDFDYHSGSDKTMVRPAYKREVAGSNSWSDMKKESDMWVDEEFEKSEEKNADVIWKDDNNENQCPTDEPLKDKTNDNLAETVDSKENEPIDDHTECMKEMTLDEWKREQEAKRVVPKYNLRKPGEGEDGNQWKKLYMLKKKAKEDDDDDEEDDEDIDDEFGRRGRHRQLIDIQINFNDSRRGRGRGRGGVRGIGPRSTGFMGNKDIQRPERRDDGPAPNIGRSFGRGGVRGNKSGHQSAPRVDDWNDFPSLVA